MPSFENFGVGDLVEVRMPVSLMEDIRGYKFVTGIIVNYWPLVKKTRIYVFEQNYFMIQMYPEQVLRMISKGAEKGEGAE